MKFGDITWGGDQVDLSVVGANHETAPIAVRERLVLEGAALSTLYDVLAGQPAVDGVVVLSTCNRTEIYWAGDQSARSIVEAWAREVRMDPDHMTEHLFVRTGMPAVRHLFRVASGLESMMLGETEILGQVKAAYRDAQSVHAVGRLHGLLRAATRVGKRARRETAISEHALSMGYAAVELTRKVYGHELGGLSALVVGAGEMGTLAARHLAGAGVGMVRVVNRTPERAAKLAAQLGGQAVSWGDLGDAVLNADVIVSCTRSPTLVVDEDMVRRAARTRRGKPLMLLDLAVPRDVAQGVEDLSDAVFRYDLDDLSGVVIENRRRREREVEQVAQVIEEEVEAFGRELEVTRVAPVIRSLREKAEHIRQAELARAWDKLPGLSDEERAVVDRTTRLILNRLLNDPMVSIRGWAGAPDGAVYLKTLRDLFRLDEVPAPTAPEK